MSSPIKVHHHMRDKILAAAVKVAEKIPLHAVTRGLIAKKAKCAPSLVTWYLGNMDEARSAIIHAACGTNNVEVIAWALAARYPGADKAPPKLKRAALKIIAQ